MHLFPTLLQAFASLTLLCTIASADEARFEVKDSDLTYVEHFSMQPPYVDEYLMSRYWDFGGNAYVDINRFVRITPNRQSMKGWVWARMPVVNPKSWVCEFEFKVHGGDRLFGDGFAFWYTTGRKQVGDVFGGADRFDGLGVFFDTYTNGRNRAIFPLITGMIGDGMTKYDESTDGQSNAIGSCTAQFREKEYVTRAKVIYVENKMVQVFIDVDGLGTWKNCFTKNDVTLPERGYFGFTSHTGDAADNHDLIRIMTYQIENEHTGKQEPPSSQPTRVDRRPDINLKTNTPVPLSAQGTSSGASYVWYGVLVVFIILAVGGIGAAAFVAYSKMNSPKSYKRF